MKATLLRNIIPFIAFVHNLYAFQSDGDDWMEKNTYIFHLIKAVTTKPFVELLIFQPSRKRLVIEFRFVGMARGEDVKITNCPDYAPKIINERDE